MAHLINSRFRIYRLFATVYKDQIITTDQMISNHFLMRKISAEQKDKINRYNNIVSNDIQRMRDLYYKYSDLFEEMKIPKVYATMNYLKVKELYRATNVSVTSELPDSEYSKILFQKSAIFEGREDSEYIMLKINEIIDEYNRLCRDYNEVVLYISSIVGLNL